MKDVKYQFICLQFPKSYAVIQNNSSLRNFKFLTGNMDTVLLVSYRHCVMKNCDVSILCYFTFCAQFYSSHLFKRKGRHFPLSQSLN